MMKRRGKAQSFIEVVTGCLVMVPIALLVVDVVFVLNLSQQNADLALASARMAANQPNDFAANMTVREALYRFNKPANCRDVSLNQFRYDEVRKVVTVTTAMEISLPVPLPGCTSTTLTASSVQPIVGIPALR